MVFRPFIYGLADPLEPKHVRYVGMAGVNASRPYDHAKNARKGRKHTYLLHWIRGIQLEGREPVVLILEQLHENASRDLVGFVEQCYIDSLAKIGHRLTNATRGGEGGTNGPETRAKIAAALTGFKHTPEARANMAASHVGSKRTEAAKKNMSIAQKGRIVTQAARNKLAQAMRGRKVSPETRARQSAGIKAARRTPEARARASVKQKEVWARRKAERDSQ